VTLFPVKEGDALEECSVMDELQFGSPASRRRWRNFAGSLAFPVRRVKIFDRYQNAAFGAHRPKPASVSLCQPTSFPGRELHLNVKREYPSWGARKIRERLLRRFSGIPMPAKSTIRGAESLRPGGAPRSGASSRQGTPLSCGQRPNELWCTDYKGEFCWGIINTAIR
jgi:hypothetical protein